MITNLEFKQVNTNASLKWSTKRFGRGPIILLISAIFLIHLNDNTDTVSTANFFLFVCHQGGGHKGGILSGWK